jgi:hypothetical protein
MVELGQDLECRLRSYAAAAKGITKSWDKVVLAASAVGVTGFGVLASLPLEAEVVYTATHKVMYRDGRAGESILSLDVNNDGAADFTLALWRGSSFSSGNARSYGGMSVFGKLPSNQVMSSSKGQWKAALPSGSPIGPGARFVSNHYRMAYCANFSGRSGFSSGPWRNVMNRYLGLKFLIDGEVHYGWARLNVTYGCSYALTLTGYAYETVPDQPLDAGVLPFANDGKLSPKAPLPSSPKQATLGALATGAAGLSIWRGE